MSRPKPLTLDDARHQLGMVLWDMQMARSMVLERYERHLAASVRRLPTGPAGCAKSHGSWRQRKSRGCLATRQWD